MSWVGQAIVASSVSPLESLDLYRHAFELESPLEACALFAQEIVNVFGNKVGSERDPWLCQCGEKNVTMRDHCHVCHQPRLDRRPTAHNLKDASHYWLMASDSVARYIASSEGALDAWAHNTAGVIEEKLGRLHAAKGFYARARELASDNEHMNTIVLNLARVTAAVEGAATGLSVWTQGKISHWEHWCSIAVAYYRANDLPTAYQVGCVEQIRSCKRGDGVY